MSAPRWIIGVDEAGRGPLAGPVVAAAVILDAANPVSGLRDSKKLSPRQREALFPVIRSQSLAHAIALASAEEIDQINILKATLTAMNRAVQSLQAQLKFADHEVLVLVDGNRLPPWSYPSQAIVKGDAKEPAISAASILAKTHRDALMLEIHAQHPGYGFDVHMGYPTPDHLSALTRLGPCSVHRRSFGPVRAAQARVQDDLFGLADTC